MCNLTWTNVSPRKNNVSFSFLARFSNIKSPDSQNPIPGLSFFFVFFVFVLEKIYVMLKTKIESHLIAADQKSPLVKNYIYLNKFASRKDSCANITSTITRNI